MKKLAQLMIAVFMGLMVTACAQKNIPTPFTPTDLNSKVTSGDYVQKVDNFLLILDDTKSMNLDRHWSSPLDKAKVVAHNMNNTIPALKLQAGMRAFGPNRYSLADGSALQHGMTAHSKSAFGEAVNSVMKTGGNTPLARTFTLAEADLANSTGDIAVVVVSDGEENIGGSAVKAAKELKDKYKDRICIYTILIGNSAAGRATMEKIAQASGCGFATDEEALSTPAGMASFVEKVFLKPAEKVVVPPPPPVDKKCFTIELKVEFDFDKSKIKSQYFKTLTEFADLVRAYPNHTVNLEGHTCNIGTDAYNMKLGQRRADSVRNFILKNFKDIDPARLTAISYGETKPAVSNDKKDQRPHNRRVFATFTYCEK